MCRVNTQQVATSTQTEMDRATDGSANEDARVSATVHMVLLRTDLEVPPCVEGPDKFSVGTMHRVECVGYASAPALRGGSRDPSSSCTRKLDTWYLSSS